MKFFNRFKGVFFCGVTFLVCLPTLVSADNFEPAQCPIGEPLGSWNFDSGDAPINGAVHVEWSGEHGGVQSIPDTKLQGIRFHYKGKGPEGDSSSEWRYKINMPLSRTWEYLRILQPKNYRHRYFVKIETPSNLNESNWKEGDEVENPWGMTAVIGGIDKNFIFIENFSQRFDKNWGNSLILFNKTTQATTEMIDSRIVGMNNKLSAQWQGKYSNAGMIVEVEAKVPKSGGEPGVGYFRPTINTSKAHKGSGTVSNKLSELPGVAFDPRDNGQIVEFTIERVRSSGKDKKDGSYRIWKRTESTTWELIHENTSLYVWQPDNYFDHGYVFGWANSGYSEDTDFYLLQWQLWAEKPSYLP